MAFRTNKTPVLQEKSASGSVATFNTALAMPLDECEVSFGADEDGVSSIEIDSYGKNLLNADDYYSAYKVDNSYYTTGGNFSRIKIPLNLPIGTPVTFSAYLKNDSGILGTRVIASIDGSTIQGNPITTQGYTSVTFTVVSENDYVSITYGTGGTNKITASEIQIEVSNSRTSYESYVAKTTYTIPFGQSLIDGGVVDVKNGIVTPTGGTPFNITPIDVVTRNAYNTFTTDIGTLEMKYKDLDIAKRGRFREVFKLPQLMVISAKRMT